MAFARNQGTCCLFLPLKLGVGLIAMAVFAQSVVSVLALFTGDIRFQPNGYSLLTYRLPSIMGSFGILFGFMGLLGVYEDKFLWVWAFNRFMLLKLAAMLVTMLADRYELGKCDSWLDSSDRLAAEKFGVSRVDNPAMTALAEAHVCPWARWAYMLGFSIDFTVWAYFTYKAVLLERELRAWVPYPIDFGEDKHDAASRWRLYGVKDPRADEQRKPTKKQHAEEDAAAKPMQTWATSSYGSMEPGPADGYETHVGASSQRAKMDSTDLVHNGKPVSSKQALISAGASKLDGPVGPPAVVRQHPMGDR